VAITLSRTPQDERRNPSPNPSDEPCQPALGRASHPRRTAQARQRVEPGYCRQAPPSAPKGSLPTWRSFLRNQMTAIAAVDMFVVATATFNLLYAVIVLSHHRRRVIHFEVTQNPTQTWLARQITEAFPWDTAPRYLLRDRDTSYGIFFQNRVRAMGIEEVLTAPRSPWQNPYVERIIGSIRRDCLDHVIIFNEMHLRRVLSCYFRYYHRSRTHLSLNKDCPEPRSIQPPSAGKIVAFPEVGGLHHRYERRAA
jgi:putative transposase